jgi:hypothetical protein
MPAAADTHIGGSGKVGVHALVDSPETPGVRCRYGPTTQTFTGVRVWSPIMYARNKGPGVDKQPGSWRVILQRQQDEQTTWTTVAQTGKILVQLRDNLPPGRVSVDLGHAGEPTSAYRVIVRMEWSKPGDPGTVAGFARHRVDWYRTPVDPAHPGSCTGAIL